MDQSKLMIEVDMIKDTISNLDMGGSSRINMIHSIQFPLRAVFKCRMLVAQTPIIERPLILNNLKILIKMDSEGLVNNTMNLLAINSGDQFQLMKEEQSSKMIDRRDMIIYPKPKAIVEECRETNNK